MEEAGSSNLPQPINFPANESASGGFVPFENLIGQAEHSGIDERARR